MSETSTLIGYQGRTISRQELALIPTPAATSTHVPVPHHEIVQALVETLGFRHIRVAADEYAVSPDGMKMFGVLDLETEMLVDAISVGVDRMQRNFEPMRQQVETWRQTELSTVTAKMIIYQAFIESELKVPRHLARRVHDLYFSPQYP